MNRRMRTRMYGGVGRAGEKPALTRLGFVHYLYPYFYGNNVSIKYYFLCALISATISSKLKSSNHFPLSFV